MQAIFETLFDVVYLVTVITLGILMIRGSKGRRQYLLYGVMAVRWAAATRSIWCPGPLPFVPRDWNTTQRPWASANW